MEKELLGGDNSTTFNVERKSAIVNGSADNIMEIRLNNDDRQLSNKNQFHLSYKKQTLGF